MKLQHSAQTDVGKSRDVNQDSFKIGPQLPDGSQLFVVCDGMGGHLAGEVASQTAVETLVDTFPTSLPTDIPNALTQSFLAANQAVFERGRGNMGTTAVALLIYRNLAFIANVGDSRAYLFRNGELRQVSVDHSFVEEQVRAGLLTREQAARSHVRGAGRALGWRPRPRRGALGAGRAPVAYSRRMSRTRRLLLLSAAFAGWAAALVAAYVVVQLRYRWGDPASAAASSGARAFSDVTLILTVFGALSLPATWALLAALRDVAAAWRALSWSGLAWTALAPACVAVRFVAALPRGEATGAWTVPLEAANAYAFIRLLATPACVPALALAWWVCLDDASARRLRWAFAFEAAGLGGLLAFLGAALLRGGT